MPIPLRCSGCSRTINAPDNAAGKRVKCPACATVLSVPASSAPAAARAKSQAVPSAPASQAPSFQAPATQVPVSSAPLYSPFEPERVDDDGLLTDSDFKTFNPAAPRGPSGPEIPQAKKKQKRPASFYKVPAIFGIVAASLNIAAALGLVVFMILLIVWAVQADEAGLALLIGFLCLRLLIFSVFTIGGSIHAIVASLNLLHQTSRTACGVAVGEFFFNPIAFSLLTYFTFDSIIAAIVVGCVFALWNWPCAGWFAWAISGEQAKIDFEEVDDDELEELAAELQRRAAKKEGGH